MDGAKENIVLYDWLSFTSKVHTPEDLISALGLSQCPWQEIKGAHGYRDRKYFSCISIHYNGREDMGVWVEMSGQGCRTFETVQTAIDGRLKLLEDRMASILYKQTVEMDMAISILLQSVNVDESVLRQERAKSIAAVRHTNGRLRMEQKLRELENAEWQD